MFTSAGVVSVTWSDRDSSLCLPEVVTLLLLVKENRRIVSTRYRTDSLFNSNV